MRSYATGEKSLVRIVFVVLLAILFPSNPAPASAAVIAPWISVPSGLTAPAPFSPSTNSMQLFITPPTSDGGANIDEWEFKAYPGGITNIIYTNTLSTWESLGLNPGTTYSFTVRFKNGLGWSEESPRSISISTLALPAPIQNPTLPTAIDNPIPVINRVPIPMRLSVSCIPEGTLSQLTVSGERLDSVTSASVGGKEVSLSNISANSIELTVPALPIGNYDILYQSSWGSVSQQGALRVCVSTVPKPTVSPTSSPTISPSTSPTTSPEPPSNPLVRGEATAFFAANSAALTSAARRTFQALADDHIGMKSSFAVVEGFASSPTSPSFARSLANRRAIAVVQYLRSLGLNAFYRVAANIDLEGTSALNRRVEVSLTSRPN